MSWLDDFIAWINPRWGFERANYRHAAKLASEGYRGARHTRVGSDDSVGGRADYHAEATGHRRELVERARDLERRNVLAEGLLARACENVVGEGFRLKPTSGSVRFDARAKDLWDDWCAELADVRRLDTFSDLLVLVYRSWLRDGDVGTILLSDGSLQMIESDQITNPGGHYQPSREWVDGLRLDRRGRPTSFYVVSDPDPIWTSVQHQRGVEVSAEDFIFLARRQRLGQTRGISAFAGVTWLLEQLDSSIEATVVAQRLAACIGLVLKRNTRMNGLSTTTNNAGNAQRTLAMEPGAILELYPDEDMEQINPAQPGTNYRDFVSLLGRLVGVPFGIPLEISMLDFSQTNYSSSRSSALQAQKTWRQHQAMLRRYCSDIYKWKVINWVRAGKLPATPGAMDHSWITPGWSWVDPQKDLMADLAAVDFGIKTLTQIVEERGGDFASNVQIREGELKLLDKHGIPLMHSTGSRDPAPEPAEVEEPAETDDAE